MVLEPKTELYQKLLEYIPKTRAWDSKKDEGIDGYNSGHGHQGFLSAFFLSNVTDDTMYTMSYGASVLSSDLKRVKENGYFWKYRNEAIQTIHFTTDKPWMGKTGKNNNPIICAVLREWLESIADAPKDKLPSLPDILQQCKEAEASQMKTDEELKAETERQRKLRRHRRAVAAHKRRKAVHMLGKG
jgi:hypothetical protein